jgi:hypothetical protein
MAEKPRETHQSEEDAAYRNCRINWSGTETVTGKDADKEHRRGTGDKRQPMAEQDLKKNGDPCKKRGFLKIDYFKPRGRGLEGRNDFRYDDQRGDSDGQPLEAKKQKLSNRRDIVQGVFKMLIQFGSFPGGSLK